MTERVPVNERIARRILVDPISGCFEWQGARTADGYGCVKIDGRVAYTHRVMYALFVGDLIDGMHVDHLCHNRRCCNPTHLEQVMPDENVRRGNATFLVASEVAVIKARALAGEAFLDIARDFAVSPRTVCHIHAGESWRGVAPAALAA